MSEPTLRVTEIFRSIQGESTRAGFPCAFVRLTGCSLRGVWCDTEYAFHGGTEMTVAEAAVAWPPPPKASAICPASTTSSRDGSRSRPTLMSCHT